MAKYRKRPVVFEAFQMTKERRLDNSEWPSWLHKAWQLGIMEVGCLFCSTEGCLEGEPYTPLFIQTPEGTQCVSWNDWIIQEIRGEIYPCKPDIFEATYELVK